MPRFAVLIYAGDSRHAPTATPEELQECDEHFDSLVASGRMRAAYALTPRSMARTLRADGPTDGPYGSGDVIAGFYILDAADIDEAIHLARKDPSLLSGGGVEVRPVHSGGPVTPPA
ncbi:YciI family protein [Microbacterium sp. NPDC055599]